MLGCSPHRNDVAPIAGDTGYDTTDFVAEHSPAGYARDTSPPARPTDVRRSTVARRAIPDTWQSATANGCETLGWIKTSPEDASSATSDSTAPAWFKITAAVYNLIRITASIPDPADHTVHESPAALADHHSQPSRADQRPGTRTSQTPSLRLPNRATSRAFIIGPLTDVCRHPPRMTACFAAHSVAPKPRA